MARSEDGEVELSARAKTLLPLLRKALLVVVSTIVGFIVLSEIGVNIGPLLAGAGVIGLAVGFGSQTLVKDVITGVFILAEDQFAVGDVVRVEARELVRTPFGDGVIVASWSTSTCWNYTSHWLLW